MPASSAASRASTTRSVEPTRSTSRPPSAARARARNVTSRLQFGERQRPREHFFGPLHVRRGRALTGEQPRFASDRIIAARGGPLCQQAGDLFGLRKPVAAHRDARRQELQPLALGRPSASTRRAEPALGLIQVQTDQRRLRKGKVNPRLLSLATKP